jgi:hypothetical protein
MSETTQTNKFSEILLGKNWKNVRIILSALLIFALILIVAFNFNSLFYLDSSPPENEINWHEISFLIVTCTIVLWLKLPDDLISDMKSGKKERGKYSFFLLLFVIGIIIVWFAVRAVGTFIFRINTELSRSSIRQASDVLSLIGYVVAANLPFTLLRTYHGGASRKGDEDIQSRSDAYQQNLKIIKGAIDVLLQAILIILMTLVPILGKEKMLEGVGGYIGFSTIFLSIIGTLIVFLIIRKRICSEILNYE